MAKTSPAKYIREKVRAIRELTLESGNRMFQRVGRCASIDIEKIMLVPTLPCCLVTQLGGELNSSNNEIWTKRMGVTIVLQSLGDVWLDAVADKMDEYTELLIDGVHATRDDDAIFCMFQSEDEAFSREDSMVHVLMKTMIFQYTIDRIVPSA